MKFRDYQQDAYDEIHDAWNSGDRNVCAVMPTGAGKTVLSSGVVRDNKSATAVIAHRQELVGQLSTALARNEVHHRIIAPDKTIKLLVGLQIQDTGSSFYDSRSPVAVAGVDTLLRRHEQYRNWFLSVGMWLIDECFPAGTEVSGRDIEDLRVGDVVEAFNEETGEIEAREVTHLFKNPAPDYMVRIETQSHHVIICTHSHPVYTRRGWVEAKDITRTDEVLVYEYSSMSLVREGFQSLHLPQETTLEAGEDVLLDRMLESVQGESVVRNDGQDEPKVCVGEDEEKQPNAERRNAGESVQHPAGDRPQTLYSRREREAAAGSREKTFRAPGPDRVFEPVRDPDSSQKRKWVPDMLQSGRREQSLENRSRGGRPESWRTSEKTSGRKERRASGWSGVAGVTVQKSTDLGRSRECSYDGFVYNIEVEGLHTYLANGVVVHNCHHVVRKNKWGKAVDMFPNARGLGVTATPTRADGHGLGRHADGVFDRMIVGPTMRDLINRGFLTDYRIFAPASDLDLSRVDLSKATGDFNATGVRNAVHQSHIVGDVVKEYCARAHGKLGVTFAVDVQSATDIANAFNAAGVRAEVVSAKTKDVMRADILRRFRQREIFQLVNVDLFGEGFDLPAIEVVSMARPTASYSLFCQQFGRALRILEGKTEALIIDHVGNCIRHGLPDAPREWTLDRREKRSGVNTPDDVIPVKACPQCTGVYERIHKACPYCGYYAKPEARSGPEMVDGDLTELDAETLAAMRGEAARVSMTPAEFQLDMHKRRVPDVGRPRQMRAFKEQQAAQTDLRGVIATWNAYHAGLGRDEQEIYKRFYWAFGSDQLTACALPTRDARALTNKMYVEVRKWK